MVRFLMKRCDGRMRIPLAALERVGSLSAIRRSRTLVDHSAESNLTIVGFAAAPSPGPNHGRMLDGGKDARDK
jgi:hypothetical protein